MLQEGRGSAQIRYSQLPRFLNGMQFRKRENIIALHQQSIHRFRLISMPSTVTLSKFHLQWPLVLSPKPENRLFISLITYSDF
jgi:hypothetical protein